MSAFVFISHLPKNGSSITFAPNCWLIRMPSATHFCASGSFIRQLTCRTSRQVPATPMPCFLNASW